MNQPKLCVICSQPTDQLCLWCRKPLHARRPLGQGYVARHPPRCRRVHMATQHPKVKEELQEEGDGTPAELPRMRI